MFLISIYSKFLSFAKTKKRVIYLLSFPDNNHGFIEQLNQQQTVIVFYNKKCHSEALRLREKGIKIYPLDSLFYFISYTIPVITNSRVVICDNYFPFLGAIKKKNQVFIQIWHAVGAVKCFGLEEHKISSCTKADLKRYKNVYRSFDKYIVSSHKMSQVFQRSYLAQERQMLYFGLPRTDFLFQQIKVESDFDKRKVILYAPTYRDNQVALPPLDIKQLEEKLGDQYRLIVKLHPHIQFLIGTQEDTSFVRWCRKDESLNNLILEADILISDYSSVLFDFSLVNPNSPIILFWYDRDLYEKKIGIQEDFLKIDSLPVVNSTTEIITLLTSDTLTSTNLFNKEWNTYNDGQATIRLLAYVRDIVGGNKW